MVDVLSPPVLTDGVVRLRRWDFTDIACVEAASTGPRIPEGTTVPAVYSAGEARAFIERQWSRADAGEGLSLAVAEEVSDRAIGLISLMHRPQPAVVGLGYWVIPGCRGLGVATRAVQLAADWVLTTGVARLEAWAEHDNLASQHVLERTGFELEGRLRSFLGSASRRTDALAYSRIAEPGSLQQQ